MGGRTLEIGAHGGGGVMSWLAVRVVIKKLGFDKESTNIHFPRSWQRLVGIEGT